MADITEIKTEVGDVQLENGILFIHFTVTELLVPALKLHNLAIEKAFGHLFPLPVIIIALANTKQASKEVREYSSSAEYTFYMSSLAILVNSIVMRMIANLFMKFVKMPIPTQVFSDREAAIVWAKTFIK